jgi:membrane protein DedA with SNARE-associated domain
MNTQIAAALASFGLPNIVTAFFATHPYGIIFISLLFGGGVIIFPAFYLAVTGMLNAIYILGIMTLASIVADSFWYMAGRGIFPHFIERHLEKGKHLKKINEITEGKELIFLFYSKFVFGTRIATQLLCGARKVNFFLYIIVTIIAVLLLGIIYYLAIRLTAVGVDSLGDLKYKLGIVLAVTMLTVGGLHFVLYRLFKKKFVRE